MKPIFQNALDWEKAQLLMQPTFIRVMDNLRKQLEKSSWQGTYEEVTTPYPGYQLILSSQEQSVSVNIWEICFQICFLNYEPKLEGEKTVQIDTDLIGESGEVDWHRLEAKTQSLIQEIFTSLPTI